MKFWVASSDPLPQPAGSADATEPPRDQHCMERSNVSTGPAGPEWHLHLRGHCATMINWSLLLRPTRPSTWQHNEDFEDGEHAGMSVHAVADLIASSKLESDRESMRLDVVRNYI